MKKSIFLSIRPSVWGEILLFFLLIFLIAHLLQTPFNFFTVSPQPFWIIVILIATQYGTVEGLLAALVSTSVLLLLGPLPTPNILADPFDRFFILAKTPILWFIASVVLGELRLRQLREVERLKQKAETAAERENKVANAYLSLQTVKESLELQIASEMPTALLAIARFREMEERGKERVVQGALDLIQTLFNPEQYSIYFLEKNLLNCVGSIGWKENETYSRTLTETSPLFQEIVDHKRSISVRTTDPKILGEEGVLAVPIFTQDSQVIGMIKIEEIPFTKLNTGLLEALVTIGKWIGLIYKRDL